MGYRPFKMRGHELPGPNQRKYYGDEELFGDPNATSSQLQEQGFKPLEEYDEESRRIIENSPQYKEAIANRQQNNVNEQPNNQLSTDTTDFSASGATSDATKKKVDVEVTVNGQKV